MAKKTRSNVTRSKPLTLAALREYGALDGFSPPGRFAPGGKWKNTYRIWLVSRRNAGFLSIEREPATDPPESAALDVQMSVLQAAGTVHRTKAKLQCAAHALSTPQSWEIESEILDTKLQPIELTKVNDTVTVEGETTTVKTNHRSSVRKIPAAFTSNWSLFDAVQRLPAKDTIPLEFDVLEDLDLLKERQRLSYWQSMEFTIGDDTLHLTGYQQIGQGILPYQYWVDDQRRLLFVISGIRAYIFDPNAQEDFEQQLQKLARRKR